MPFRRKNLGTSSGGEPAGQQAAYPRDLAPTVGENLRKLRVRRGLSLDRFSRASGVSRAMLSQIERGKSAPTINVLSKISRALAVPFSALISSSASQGVAVLRAGQVPQLISAGGNLVSRALFPYEASRRVEFYELRMTAGSEEDAGPHPTGTVENLVVREGGVEIEVSGRKESLAPGDAIVFMADVPHSYRNPTAVQSVIYLVMTYAEQPD